MAIVAQLVRASGCGPEGRGFRAPSIAPSNHLEAVGTDYGNRRVIRHCLILRLLCSLRCPIGVSVGGVYGLSGSVCFRHFAATGAVDTTDCSAAEKGMETSGAAGI